jgi:hypothetical protein
MSQTKRNIKLQTEIGARLGQLVEIHLGRPWSEMATALGYANSSTLLAAKDGTSSLSVEKLALLAEQTSDGRRVSIDWLLTGKGFPFVNLEPEAIPRASSPLVLRVARAPRSTQRKIEAFLDLETVARHGGRSHRRSPSTVEHSPARRAPRA